jgi:acyl-CoA dehydrogenase
MNFQLSEEHRAIQDLIRKFVQDELLPLEPLVLEREASGHHEHLTSSEIERLRGVAQELGLYGLDAPADVGGVELPELAMIAVNEEMGKTITPFVLPPDSPNLRMLMNAADERQKEAYLAPYVAGETISAIGISEPGAGSDPSQMKTVAVRDGDDWVLNGRKIWISRADVADFTIVMAITDKTKGAHGGMSAFLVDNDSPGFNVMRRIPMLGGHATFEVELDNCRVPGWKLLGKEGHGFAAMQVRLGSRRLEMAANCIGMAQRALDMLCEYASQRVVFGETLSSRQSIQWVIADAEMNIHAARLMAYNAAWKMDEGYDIRHDISMAKAFSTELAWDVIDKTMQAHGAMGMTKELPLQMMANVVRLMRIYDGPTEVHKMVIARNKLRNFA